VAANATGSTGWVRSRACTCVFSSIDSTTYYSLRSCDW
jgi:hypothetical protein